MASFEERRVMPEQTRICAARLFAILSTVLFLDRPTLAQCDPPGVTRLWAADGAADDRFGRAVAISGDLALVGSYQDDDNGIDSGSAYLFFLGCPALAVEPQPLVAGQDAIITVTDSIPSRRIYLGYSRFGTGRTYVQQLNVVMGIVRPTRAGGVLTVDEEGRAQWTLAIPESGAGLDIWFQACQRELTTNVVETHIE